MGYYTRYALELDTFDPDLIREVEAALGALTNVEFSYAGSGRFEAGEETKWYGHEADVRALSVRFPAVRFLLAGEGEENGDLWRKYFRAGRMQECRASIVYPPFDEGHLR